MMPLTGFQKTLEGLLAANSALGVTTTMIVVVISKLQPQTNLCRYIWGHLTFGLWDTDNLPDGN